MWPVTQKLSSICATIPCTSPHQAFDDLHVPENNRLWQVKSPKLNQQPDIVAGMQSIIGKPADNAPARSEDVDISEMPSPAFVHFGGDHSCDVRTIVWIEKV
jgi:hypothetical protein